MGTETRQGEGRAHDRFDTATDYARLLVDTANLIVLGLDTAGRVTMWNRAAEVVTGWTSQEIVGKSWLDHCIPPERGAATWEALVAASTTGAPPTQSECAIVTKKGEERVVDWQHGAFHAHGMRLGTISFGIDVTERKRAEDAMRASQARLQSAERLAALGTLAGGMAHEINNPLAYVKLNLSLLDRMLDSLASTPDREARDALVATMRERVAEAQQGTSRVAEVVHGLQTFSRPESDVVFEVDVRVALDGAIERAMNEVRHRARLVRAYGDVPLVYGDPGQLGGAFWHLLVNAAQAIPEGAVDQHEIRVATSTDAAGNAVVEVSDTGAGISPGADARIFDPFFTTRPLGGGLGLGLSVCHGIVTALGGEIAVETRVGRGTTLRVILPPAAAAPARASSSGRGTSRPPGSNGRGRVLVVDDEPALASAIAALLSDKHDVVTAASGRDALARLAEDRDFDVVLCDLMMPDIGGIELYETLAAAHPRLAERIVFMTGGAFTRRAHEFLLSVPNPKLDKPLDLARVEELVAARVGGAP